MDEVRWLQTTLSMHLASTEVKAIGRKLLSSLDPDFLATGLIVDTFQVVGMVQVYNKNWNSLVKTGKLGGTCFQNPPT